MEMVVAIVVGILGATATIVAAYIQGGKKQAQHIAEEAKVASSVRKTDAEPVIPARDAGSDKRVQCTLIFPGSGAFSLNGMNIHREGYVLVLIDGEKIGRGLCRSGFKMSFESTVGLHDLVLMWDGFTLNM